MEQRVIKFRAKRIDNRQWIYGWFVGDTLNPELGHMVDYADNAGDSYTMEDVDGTTVGQFTGLLDKNGKEIYEGDIVEVDGSGLYGGNEKYKGTFEIEVVLSAWGHEYNWKPIRGYSCSTHIMSDEENGMIPNACVIGNIYEPAKDPQP